MEYQQDWLGHDLESKGQKWEMLTARATPDEKRDVFLMCKTVIKLPYSVITRLIWRKILHNYRTMPQVRHNEVEEVEKAVDEVLEYIPIIRRQRQYAPRQY
jgi:hypothetical protein